MGQLNSYAYVVDASSDEDASQTATVKTEPKHNVGLVNLPTSAGPSDSISNRLAFLEKRVSRLEKPNDQSRDQSRDQLKSNNLKRKRSPDKWESHIRRNRNFARTRA